MSDTSTDVGGLPLPAKLLQLIAEGRWKPPSDPELIRQVFHDEPDGPHFYTVPQMILQNRSFQTWQDADPFGQGDESSLAVVPRLAVLIGDLGADMPIALDYQLDRDRPRVVYLGPRGWIEVAPDIDTLCRLLAL